MSGQTLLIMAGALVLMVSTVRLVRNRLLSIRYGIGWLILGTLGIVGAPLLTYFVDRLHVLGFTPTGFSLGIFILFLGLVCLQLSVSLSGLHRAVQDITEHSAHLDARLRRLEGGRAPKGALGAPVDLQPEKGRRGRLRAATGEMEALPSSVTLPGSPLRGDLPTPSPATVPPSHAPAAAAREEHSS